MARMETRNALGFRPLYRQARDVLVGRINDGTWQAGQAIPSEHEIAADLGVSPGTARKALDEMESENLVIRHQGRGTFVARHDDARIIFQFFKLTPDSGEREFPGSKILRIDVRAAKRLAATRSSLWRAKWESPAKLKLRGHFHSVQSTLPFSK